jgi:hypothetical protein
MDNRKTLEGLTDKPGKRKYPSPSTKNDLISLREWKPNSGTDLDKDHVITFKLLTGPNELVR